MNTRLANVQTWLKKRTPSERLTLIVIAFLAFYLVWDAIIDQSLLKHQKAANDKLNVLDKKVEESHQKLVQMDALIHSSTYKRALQKGKQLSQVSQSVKQQVSAVLPRFTEENDMPIILKEISVKQPGITLVSLKSLPAVKWAPYGLVESDLPDNMHNIMKYPIVVEILGNYFAIVDYFARLEKLPWYIYWESMSYEVTKYPDAKIIATAYILISPEGKAKL